MLREPQGASLHVPYRIIFLNIFRRAEVTPCHNNSKVRGVYFPTWKPPARHLSVLVPLVLAVKFTASTFPVLASCDVCTNIRTSAWPPVLATYAKLWTELPSYRSGQFIQNPAMVCGDDLVDKSTQRKTDSIWAGRTSTLSLTVGCTWGRQ